MVHWNNRVFRHRRQCGAAVCACLVLTGCIDLKRFQKENVQTRADVEQLREHQDRENCIAAGTLPGSQGYLGCMLKHANARADLPKPNAKP